MLPVLAMLLLGIVSSGIAYHRNLSLSQGARESARHGATLPVSSYASLSDWLTDIGDRAIADAAGQLEPGIPGRSICVAYVHPNGTAATPLDRTTSKTVTGDGTFAAAATSHTTCFDDGRPASERRVQVRVERETEFGALFFSRTLTLSSEATSRYEAFRT